MEDRRGMGPLEERRVEEEQRRAACGGVARRGVRRRCGATRAPKEQRGGEAEEWRGVGAARYETQL